MKAFIFFYSLIVIGHHLLIAQPPLPYPCGASSDPNYTAWWQAQSKKNSPAQPRSLPTLPIVVHIVYHDSLENISDAQVQSQIAALNRHFGGVETQRLLPTPFFAIANQAATLQFCLAQLDPDGQPTSGVTRTYTPYAGIGTAKTADVYRIHQTTLGGKSGWDATRYINVWVGACEGILGRATYPNEAFTMHDGIVIDPRNFGTIGTSLRKKYNEGKTLTHEMGHYLGLQHPWGAILNECAEDDDIADTPPQAVYYTGCPTYPQRSCHTNDVYVTYMDFCDDNCLLLFTQQQMARMQALVQTVRSELIATSALTCPAPAPPANPLDVLQLYQTATHLSFVSDAIDDTALRAIIYTAIGQSVGSFACTARQGLQLSVQGWASGIYWVQFSMASSAQRRVFKVVIP